MRRRRRRCSASPRSTCMNLPRDAGRRSRLRAGLLRQAGVPHGERPARRRDLRLGFRQGLHVRSHVSRRELQHAAPPRRVLDDRAGDGVLRSRRTTWSSPRIPQVHHPRRAGPLPRRPRVLQPAHRQDRARDARARRRQPISTTSPTPRRSSILEKSGKTFEFPVDWGTDLQAEHERYLTEENFKSR